MKGDLLGDARFSMVPDAVTGSIGEAQPKETADKVAINFRKCMSERRAKVQF